MTTKSTRARYLPVDVRGHIYRLIRVATMGAIVLSAGCVGQPSTEPDPGDGQHSADETGTDVLLSYDGTNCKAYATPGADIGHASAAWPNLIWKGTGNGGEWTWKGDGEREGRPGDEDPVSAYDGLACFRQRTEGSILTVGISNLNAGCGAQFDGRARQTEDGVLQLILVNQRCAIAGCGFCLYDATFEVDVSGLDAGETRVELLTQPCPDQAPDRTVRAFTLGRGRETEIVRCHYTQGFAPWTDRDGRLHGSCLYEQDVQGLRTGFCEDGLVCGEPAQGGREICMMPCDLDEDCPAPEILQCIDGVCQLAPEA